MANTYDITQKLQAIADAIENGGGGGGGGTTVIANPSGTPTDTLNTIQIASTIYDIAGGGGVDAYERTVLATPNTDTPGEISLSDDISNYDDLEIVISFPGNTSKNAFRISADYFMTEFPYVSGATASVNHLICCLYGTYYVRLIMGSANNKMYMIETTTLYLEEIAGIKYEVSGVGGSTSADNVSYDNTQSGITATNVQDAIDEIDTSVDTLNSNFSNKLQYISGKCASGFSSYVQLPTGYTINNCIILTIMVDEPGDGSMWRSGAGMGVASSRLFAEMSSNGVRVYNDFGTYIGHNFYVVLMKM